MFIISVACFLLLVCDATGVLDVNTTAGESAVLPCILTLPDPTDSKHLRFYWQDDRAHVLYSFNKGKEMREHVHELYRDRIAAFTQGITEGNISVKLENATLEDNQRVFQAFGAVFDSRGRNRFNFEFRQICQMTLHVAVPYKNISLTVNKETMTAVCTTQRGFPKPLVEWSRSDNSRHLLDLQDVNTTAVQDPHDHLYSLTSTVVIPGDPHPSVTCLVYNPTLNVTLIATRMLNNGEAERSRPSLAGALMVAAAAVLIH